MKDKHVSLGDGIATFMAGDTLIVVWKKAASPERWDWWMAQLHGLATRNPDGVLAVALITAESSPPDAKTRKKMQTDFRAFGDKLRRFVAVPLGNSMWQSVVRTIVKGTLLLSGLSDKQAVAATTNEGLDRLFVAASARTPTKAELRAGIGTICKELGVNEQDLLGQTA